MTSKDQIRRILTQHQQGIYTLLELLPHLVYITPKEDLGDLKSVLPGDLWKAFVEWVDDYPLEGGIMLSDAPPLSDEKIIWLKNATRGERLEE